MTPEAEAYLRKARQQLEEAERIAEIGLFGAAARSAYYAAYHAAEALVVERTGRATKSHSGLRAEFARLVRGDPEDRLHTRFLARAYLYKELSDYAVGATPSVSGDDAVGVLSGAGRIVAHVAALLGDPAQGAPG